MTIIQRLRETIREVREGFGPIGHEFVPQCFNRGGSRAEEEGFLYRVDHLSHDRLRLSANSVDCRLVISPAGKTQEGRGEDRTGSDGKPVEMVGQRIEAVRQPVAADNRLFLRRELIEFNTSGILPFAGIIETPVFSTFGVTAAANQGHAGRRGDMTHAFS